MGLSNLYPDLEGRDLHLTEWRFHIYSKENGIRKLLQRFEDDPTVGSKVMALSNPYADLERRDLHLSEWRFHIYSKENGIRKLL
jgi:hypothetical protein